MTANEIRAFSKKVAADTAFGGKDTKVVVKATLPGAAVFIGRDGKFSATKKEDAFVYLYDTDKVSTQLFECVCAGVVIDVEAA